MVSRYILRLLCLNEEANRSSILHLLVIFLKPLSFFKISSPFFISLICQKKSHFSYRKSHILDLTTSVSEIFSVSVFLFYSILILLLIYIFLNGSLCQFVRKGFEIFLNLQSSTNRNMSHTSSFYFCTSHITKTEKKQVQLILTIHFM